jgi:hypothetical protein
MKAKQFYIFLLSSFILIFTASHLSAQCCNPPDSLKLRSVTDSSFCVQWLVNNTPGCIDTSRSFTIEYRPVNTTTWTIVSGAYHGETLHIFCDTASPCTKYQWKVRNICIHNGDTTITDWVSGPKFNTGCDSGKSQMNANVNAQTQNAAISIKPNPARNNVLLSGYFKGTVKITITNMNGKKIFETNISTLNGKLNLPINVVNFEKGIYFVNVFDGKNTIKINFLKE